MNARPTTDRRSLRRPRFSALCCGSAALGVLLAVAACGGASTTPPPNAVSQAQAVEIATKAVQAKGSVTFISAAAGPFSKYSGGVVLTTLTGDPWVWSIVLDGSFTMTCASSAPSGAQPSVATPGATPCTEVNVPRERVVVDAASGAVLLSVGGN